MPPALQGFARASAVNLFAVLLLSISFGYGPAFAQSGSAGGSIGNEEKSLSGSRSTPRAAEPEKPARRSKPEREEPRRAARGGGGGNSFDGAWIINAVGVTCNGTGSNAIVVTSGKIIAAKATGTVSPSGSLHGVSTGPGPVITTTGRLSGRSGGGTFRRADGCTGTWTASKQ